ncbi:MAG: hypothetical protein KF690_10275 [Bacteroidetes bacterium]|nr:hypothetical protein [Bacteroidota bacterium]
MTRSFSYIIAWISLLTPLWGQQGKPADHWQLGLDPTRMYHNLYGARMLGADVILQRQLPGDVSAQLGLGYASYKWEPEQTGNHMYSRGFCLKPAVLYRVYETLSLGGALFASVFTEENAYRMPDGFYPGLNRRLGPYRQTVWGFEMQLLYTRYWGRWGVGLMPRVAFAVGGLKRDEMTPSGAQQLDEVQNSHPLLYIPGIGKENVTGALYPALQVFIMVKPLSR